MLYKKILKAIPPVPLGKMKRGKYNYMSSAQVTEDKKCGKVLVLDVYEKKNKELAVRYFCDGSNYQVYDVKHNKWYQKYIRGVLSGSRDYFSYTYTDAYRVSASEETFETVKRFFKDRSKHWDSENIFNNPDRLCREKAQDKQERRRENKQNRIDRDMRMYPELPADFNDYLRKYVFKNYIFAENVSDGKRKAICHACGKEFFLPKATKHKSVISCPECGRVSTAYMSRYAESIRDKKTLCITHKSDGQLLIRWIDITDKWRKNMTNGRFEPHYEMNEYFRTMYLNEKGRLVIRHFDYKNIYPWGAYWRETRYEGDDPAYVYTYNLDEIFGDKYYNVNLKSELEKKPYPLHFVALLDNLKTIPAAEYLVKMGIKRLASQIQTDDIHEGRGFGAILNVNPQYKALYAKYNVSIDEHYMVKASKAWVSEEDFLKMRSLNPNSNQIRTVIRLLENMSYKRFVNYFTKQRKLYGRTNLDQILRWYDDYIQMSEQMSIDLSHKSVRFPKDIKQAHDGLLLKFKAVENEIYDEQLRRASKNLYSGLTEYKSGGYAIVFPRTRTEFIAEGQSLSHCVGTQEKYFKNHLEGRYMIFFIRHAGEIDKPFVTMELDMKRLVIMQIYGYGDKRPAQEVVNFANKFVRQLKRRAA